MPPNPLSAEAAELLRWQNFYVILGSAGGALVGLQFVVIVLIASTRRRADMASVNAFGSPNVVQFSSALAISALASAPWNSLTGLQAALTVVGLLGVTYSGAVFFRSARQTTYKAVFEDWIWYSILPCCLYALLAVAALLWRLAEQAAFFMIAGAALGLLLVGVRNAWDSVTHIVVGGQSRKIKTPGATACESESSDRD